MVMLPTDELRLWLEDVYNHKLKAYAAWRRIIAGRTRTVLLRTEDEIARTLPNVEKWREWLSDTTAPRNETGIVHEVEIGEDVAVEREGPISEEVVVESEVEVAEDVVAESSGEREDHAAEDRAAEDREGAEH